MSDILVDTPIDGVARLRFNRPESMNTLTFTMYELLIEHLERIRYDHSVQVVIIAGSGRAFCAGHDLRAGGQPGWVDAELGRAQRNRAILAKLGQIPLLMRNLPQPIIVAVNGATAGAGYSIALAGDLALAAKSAKFVNAFHNAGSGHELGFSYMLPRAVGTQHAAEIMFTGRAVSAEEAAQIGLVLRTVEDDQLEAEALKLAESIMVNSPIGIAITKQTMWMNADAGSLAHAIELENRGIFVSTSTEDTAEKRKAFIEKRKPVFKGK